MTDVSVTDSGLETALARTAAAVDETIDALVSAGSIPEEDVKKDDAGDNMLSQAMRYALFAGGKRLRPFLTVTAADLFDTPRRHSLRVAAAGEMIHTYSLVHDDLPAMDDDDLRRGQPTCHIRYGEAAAILAGDALQALAFHTLAAPQTHPDPEVRCRLSLALAQACGAPGMVGGQMLDLQAEHANLDSAAITRLQTMKTGALISFACTAGAILGQANHTQTAALEHYARDLGLAFQIHDDWLDATSHETALGKRTGKDSHAGKATFVSVMGVAGARERALALIDQAVGHLSPLGDTADMLRQIAHFVIHRVN